MIETFRPWCNVDIQFFRAYFKTDFVCLMTTIISHKHILWSTKWKPMQIENLGNKAFILFVLLLSYLVNFTACFFVKFKKPFSLTRKVNLKIKESNCEKAGFRAIDAENDADMFISWRRIVNARQNIRRISVIFLASTALISCQPHQVISCQPQAAQAPAMRWSSCAIIVEIPHLTSTLLPPYFHSVSLVIWPLT